jgi:DNA-binding CsgD family transcriptional regulator
MRPNLSPIAVETQVEDSRSRIIEVLQVLVLSADEEHLSSGAGANRGQASEDVLLDTEVDGCRYLLVRMPSPHATQVRLSPREKEIVRMIAKGHSNKIIADVLSVSSWTVCTHLRRISAKLGVASRESGDVCRHECSPTRRPGGRWGADGRDWESAKGGIRVQSGWRAPDTVSALTGRSR